MTCFDAEPDLGDCGYQFMTTAAGGAGELHPVENTTGAARLDAPHLARNGTHVAAMLVAGDLSVSGAVPELFFLPFGCPAP
jgi:hypothetical protein